MANKRAQTSGTAAAILILLIGVLIVLYLLFLPPETRQSLLQDKPLVIPGQGQGGPQTGAPSILLSESPGRIQPSLGNNVEHELPSFSLFTSVNAKELLEVDSLYVKDSWFDSSSRKVSFTIDDLSKIDNVLLAFKVIEGQGRLTVKLHC